MRGHSIAALLALGAAAWAPSARADDPWGSTFKNHLAIALGFGYGNMGGGSYDNYVHAYNAAESNQNGWGTIPQGNSADPGGELHGSLSLTYYFPYYITLRSGAEVYYFQPTETGSFGGSSEIITNYGGVVAIPVLLGPHVSFAGDKLVVDLMVGPTFAAYTSGGLNANDLVNNHQLNGDFAVGVDGILGFRYIVSKNFEVGIEGGYTSLQSAKLHRNDQSGPYTDFGGPYTIDFSGFRGVVEMAILAM